jgi:hypothetical protein
MSRFDFSWDLAKATMPLWQYFARCGEAQKADERIVTVFSGSAEGALNANLVPSEACWRVSGEAASRSFVGLRPRESGWFR